VAVGRKLHAVGVAVVLLVGLWFFWPTLRGGLFADDFVSAAMVDGSFAAERGPLDLFNFADGSTEDVQQLRRLGSIPWWSPPDFRVSFLRPLSSALVHVDRALFGDAYWAYHAHSIAAWALLVIIVARLYGRLLSWPVALLATAFFALDDCQHFTVEWLSNRGGLYAMAFGILGLSLHLRWRAGGGVRHGWLSALCFSVGLLFGEWVFPAFGYVLAYELTSSWRRPALRLRALLPVTVPALAFLVTRAALGYGARGSGAYIDPGAEPGRFALSLFMRVPAFFADMVFNVPSAWWDHGSPWRDRVLRWDLIPPRVWTQLPGWTWAHLALGIAAFVLLALAARWMRSGLSARERRATSWLLLGALLALVPAAGSFMSTRMTLGAFVGVAPVLALLSRQLVRMLLRARAIAVTRWAFAYLTLVALVYLQLVAPLRHDLNDMVDEHATTVEWVRTAELDPAAIATQRVFLLNGSEFTTTFFFSYIWGQGGLALPRSLYPISTAPRAHDIERTGPNTLRVHALGGRFLASGLENMFHPKQRRLTEGYGVQLDGMHVRAARMRNGLPQTLELRFDRPVDDPSHVFLVSTRRGVERLPVPALGESVRIRRASGPNWIALRRSLYEKRMGPLPPFVLYDPIPRFIEFDPTES
jgi:hypothetical protein